MVHISIRDLTKRFGRLTVLDGLNLDIAPGELFFLLGPSGCGKTTLLRHLAGFSPPDGGRIFFDDQDVTRVPAHRRDLGMMFQSYALWPHLNVGQNVAFGLEERRLPRPVIEAAVQEALERVQLGGLAERRITQLSGGQQQRVALARALVIRPRCLLLDEPLSNLDAKLRHEMRSEIRRLCKELGLTALYVTHDRDEALSMADRLAILDAGRLVQVGVPEEVYRWPATRMVAEFIGETNLIEARAGLPAEDGLFEVETPHASLQARPNRADWHPRPGDPVLLSVRPECLSFCPRFDSTDRLRGRLVDTLYLGASVQYQLELDGGARLKICETNPREIRRPDGQWLAATASPFDVVILPPDRP